MKIRGFLNELEAGKTNWGWLEQWNQCASPYLTQSDEREQRTDSLFWWNISENRKFYDSIHPTFQHSTYHKFIKTYSLKASKYLDENSRYEMLDVLTHLEGELQAKDVTIAALKV